MHNIFLRWCRAWQSLDSWLIFLPLYTVHWLTTVISKDYSTSVCIILLSPILSQEDKIILDNFSHESLDNLEQSEQHESCDSLTTKYQFNVKLKEKPLLFWLLYYRLNTMDPLLLGLHLKTFWLYLTLAHQICGYHLLSVRLQMKHVVSMQRMPWSTVYSMLYVIYCML